MKTQLLTIVALAAIVLNVQAQQDSSKTKKNDKKGYRSTLTTITIGLAAFSNQRLGWCTSDWC